MNVTSKLNYLRTTPNDIRVTDLFCNSKLYHNLKCATRHACTPPHNSTNSLK